MAYHVIVTRDPLGATVRLLHPEDELIGDPAVRYSLALEADSLAEAACAADLIKRRLRAEPAPRLG